MTREDALKEFIRLYGEAERGQILIGKIYDDIEEELKKAYIEGGNDAWKALNCKELENENSNLHT